MEYQPMAGWVGPTIAISLLVIAVCYVSGILAVLAALKAATDRGEAISRELQNFREELAPTLKALNRFSESGTELAGTARKELDEILDTSRRIRHDIERGVARARLRLADFEAVVDVVQEEVEETALDVTAALHTARTGVGVIGQLRRLILRRR
jgi:methyl-accepting chemotaxis protein